MADHVFISHASQDRDAAMGLVDYFEGQGLTAWIAPRDVRPGTDYSIQLQHAIEACGAFLVLVSEHANRSPFVRVETEMAFSNHRPIFPCRLEDVGPAAGLALFLKIRHWIDLYGPARDANVTRLTQELAAAVDPTEAPPPERKTAARPAPAVVPDRYHDAFDTAPAPAPGPAPGPSALDDGDALLAAFVGEKADHYIPAWHRMEARGGGLSWNWAAAIFSIGWLAHRGMWRWAGIAALVQLVLQTLAFTTERLLPLMSIVQFVMPITVGLLGDRLYRDHAGAVLAKLGLAGRRDPDARRRAALAGGPSKGAGVAALLLFFMLWSAIPATLGYDDDDDDDRPRRAPAAQLKEASDALDAAGNSVDPELIGNAAAERMAIGMEAARKSLIEARERVANESADEPEVSPAS